MPWLRTGELGVDGTVEETVAPRLPPFGPQARPLHHARGAGISAPPPQQHRAERPAAAWPGCSRLRQRPGSLSFLHKLLPHLGSARPAGTPLLSDPAPEHRRVPCCRFEEALQEAQQVDKLLSEGPGDDYLEEKFPLLGVPITVKEAFSLYGGFIFVPLPIVICSLLAKCSPEWWVAVAGAWREVVSLSLVCTKLCPGFCFCVLL